MESSDDGTAEGNSGVHMVELCVYSMLSADLDGIYQSINELRESQALLILMLRKYRSSLKYESELMYDNLSFNESKSKLHELEKRLDKLAKRFGEIDSRSERLVSQS